MRIFLAAVVLHVSLFDPVRAQDDRRDRQDPELVLNVNGRVAACDALQFTPAGDRLLAVGDDKVVSIWPYAEKKLNQPAFKQRRWPVWREQRGAIYAMDVDPQGKRVVIGGLGPKTTTVAILATDRDEVIDLLNPRAGKGDNFQAVMAVAFHPAGNRVAFGTADGSVWLWDERSWFWGFERYQKLGRIEKRDFRGEVEEFNRVRLVEFLDDSHLVAVTESGHVRVWNVNGGAKVVRSEYLEPDFTVRAAVLSPDRRWLVAGLRGPQVLVVPVGGGKIHTIEYPGGVYPRSLAVDPQSKRLAVGVGEVNKNTNFFMELDDRIDLYDLTGEKPRRFLTLPHTYRAEALAFHPTDNVLAVAGGNHHEVTLWDLGKRQPEKSVARGQGMCMWDVGISQDGKAIGFRTERNPESSNVNQRAQGPWRAFDLQTRSWFPPDREFKPVERLDTVNGWTVIPDTVTNDRQKWYVTHPRLRAPLLLPLDGDREGEPLCYTFLRPKGSEPVRLVVGHYWGMSVYELTLAGVRRVRLCAGHQGEVYAVGVSPDQKWAVTAGRDQTITAWRLDDAYPSQAILGAAFEQAGKGLKVLAVDELSPAWEAGLLKDDVVTRFAFAGAWMNPDPRLWKARLENPEPGKEHLLVVDRKGKEVWIQTTSRQRPLWRFLPSQEGEWVLWMWQKPYYATSTRGDKLLGWHVNAAQYEATPSYHPLEHYRKAFNKPGVINKLLLTLDPKEAIALLGEEAFIPVRLHEKEPPLVQVVVGQPVGDGKREVTLRVTPRGDNPDRMPKLGELWINDYRFKTFNDVQKWDRQGSSYVKRIEIEDEKLRAGRNVLVFQIYTTLDIRSETTTELASGREVPDRAQLWGLAVGVNDYKSHQATVQARGGRVLFGNLDSAKSDARSIYDTLKGNQLYVVKLGDPLLDAEANRQKIIDELRRLRAARPDDVCILFFAGHGHIDPDAKGIEPWFFCCPDYDPANPKETGISSDLLYELLAEIPCRKLVILDACHAGQTAANPIRGLTPGGQGPIIFAACDPSQQSFEDKAIGHGLFTKALLEGLGDRKADADYNKDKVVDTLELFQYAQERLPQLLAASGKNSLLQTPLIFPEDGGTPFGLAKVE